ncbi:hypothetical protein [Blautia obeum]|uniref:hypothetical protein n=1 Tax=Blautia obeum TaxID=40520 RepID=UPI00321B3845
MADHEKIRRITISLAELFPEKKNQLEKNKWYYDHSYINYDEWDRNIENILDGCFCNKNMPCYGYGQYHYKKMHRRACTGANVLNN